MPSIRPVINLALVRAVLILGLVIVLAGGALAAESAPAAAESAVSAPVKPASAPALSGLRVVAVGLRSNQGRVGCTIFASPEGFPSNDKKSAGGMYVPIHDHRAVCAFTGLKPGTYAVALYHDENSNGKFDKNWLGIPQEGWGFSNDAKVGLGPPSFEAAGFSYEGGNETITVHMQYWK